MAVGLHEAPAIEVYRTLKKAGIGVKANEDEGGSRMPSVLLAGGAVASDHLCQLRPALELDHLRVGMDDELRVRADLVLQQPGRFQLTGELDDADTLGELAQEQAFLEPELPPPITSSSSAPL